MEENKETPLLSEDYTMTLDDINKQLSELHQTYIPKNDPILMIVSIHNSYITQLQKMHNKYGDALKKMIGESSGNIVEALSQTTVENLKKNLKDYVTFQRDLRWCSVIITVSAMINVIVLIWRAYNA